jgi:hypothetical protein
MIAFERRASTILYNVLRARQDPRPFLVPANMCSIVLETFEAASQPIQLADIEESELTINANEVDPDAFAGILFVRTYGTERDPSPLFRRLRDQSRDLLIIDDKCLCMPDCDGSSVSSFSDITLFSTGYAKHADVGYGGFAHLAEGMQYRRALDAPAWLDNRPPDEAWSSYRRVVMQASSSSAEHKLQLNTIYRERIPARVQLPEEFQAWRFNIRVPEPDQLIAVLTREGLFAGRHYPASENFPVAASLYREVVNLFNDRHYTEQQARRTSEIVGSYVAEFEAAGS